MKSLSEVLLKKFFTGNGYYALGRLRPSPAPTTVTAPDTAPDAGAGVAGAGGEDNHSTSNGGGVAYSPVMSPPTENLIEQHLIGDIAVGAYTLRQDSSVLWMAFDIDSTDREKAREATAAISRFLKDVPHTIEFSGRKGYHILIFFKKAVPAENVKNIGEEIRDLLGFRASGETHVEIFPKQGKVTESNPLGNLLKLPLGIHPVSNVRSRFVSILGGWEDGDEIDPFGELAKFTTLEELSLCIEGYENPIETIVKTLTPFWTEGSRHDLALYLAGWLANAGWEEEEALTVVELLQQEAGGDLDNQLQCVTDTYKKYSAGDPVQGLQALGDRLPGTTLRNLAQAISRRKITPIITLIDGIRLGKGVTYLKSRSAALAVIAYLEEKGKVLEDSNSEALYWLDRSTHHVYSMENAKWDTILYNNFGLNTAEGFGNTTARGILHTARERASKIKTHNRSWWDGENLWINLGNSVNYVISGDLEAGKKEDTRIRWGRKLLNGEEDIIFRSQESGLYIDLENSWNKGIRELDPWQYLVDDLNFGIGTQGTSPAQQKELIKAWFLSTFFPNMMPTRPLLTIVADPGAGKSTAARRFLHVLEGPHSEVNGVIADKPDSLRASIAAHKYIVLDNLEKQKTTWLVDLLNRISTGTHIELRKLHTTNEMQRITPDCFVIITATSLPFAEESLFTRLLPLELAKISKPIPEYTMQRKIVGNLDGIWMGIMQMLNITVAELRKFPVVQAPTDSRLADFSVFCARIKNLRNGDSEGILDGNNLIRGLQSMTNRQRVLLHDASPLITVLDIWMSEDQERSIREGKGPNGIEIGKWHTASELNSILHMVADKHHCEWIWDNGHGLSKHMQALEQHLMRNYAMETAPASHNTPKKYRFVPEMIDYTKRSEQERELEPKEPEEPYESEEEIEIEIDLER